MRPYYERNGIAIYHGKAEDVMPMLSAQTAYAVITDPPYGDGLHADWDGEAALKWCQCLRLVCTPNATAVSFGSFVFHVKLHAAMQNEGYRRLWDMAWIKLNGGFKVHNHLPRYQHELIVAYTHKETAIASLTFNGYEAGEAGKPWSKSNEGASMDQRMTDRVYGRKPMAFKKGQDDGRRWMTSIMDGRSKNVMRAEERTEHPTQKPLEIINRLVKLVSNPGDLILDPFVGSGTTLIAAKQLGRRAIGIEINEAYCEIAANRLAQDVLPLAV